MRYASNLTPDVFAMDASIVIPTSNGKSWLGMSLPSLAKQDFSGDFEIILVDNASVDGSRGYVEKNFPQVQILSMNRNFGYADGCNTGVSHAHGRYLIILNNDVEVDKSWLSSLVETAEEHPEYQLLASIDQYSDKKDFNVYLEVGGSALVPDDERIVPSLFAYGACFLVRREWIQKLGKLFESYFYYEDSELSLRSIMLGANIGYVTTSRYLHFSELQRGIRAPEAYRRKQLDAARFAPRTKMKTLFTLFSGRSFLKLLVVHGIYLVTLCFTRPDRSRLNLEMMRGSLEGLLELGGCAGKRSEFRKRKVRPDSFIFQRLLCNSDSLLQTSVLKFLLSGNSI